MSRGKKIAKENINTEQAAVTNQELLCAIKTGTVRNTHIVYAAP